MLSGVFGGDTGCTVDKVLIYKSRVGLSLLVQPTIQSVFFVYFDPKKNTSKQKLHFSHFYVNQDLVQTLQCTETLILYILAHKTNHPQKKGTFAKLQTFSVLAAFPKPAQISSYN